MHIHAYLVIVVEIDPPTKTLDGVSPFLTESHDDRPTLGVVLLETQLHDGVPARDAQLLVDLVLDGQTVGIPSKSALDMEALHGPVSRNDILDGGCQKMAIVRKTGRERGAVVESVERLPLTQFELPRRSLAILLL